MDSQLINEWLEKKVSLFMYDFSLSLYFFDVREAHPLDTFFISLQNKIVLYRKHSETTTELYRKELRQGLEKLKAEQLEAEEKTLAAYKKSYAEAGGSDEDKHSFATMDAGVLDMQNHFASADERLKTQFFEMAGYFNKSSLVIVYALVENELRKLCGLLKTTLNKRISLGDLEGKDYLQSIFDYFDKVLEIDLQREQHFLSIFKDIQFLRNKIMHNGGEFSIVKNEELDRIVKSSKGLLYLNTNREEGIRILGISRIDFVYEKYDIILSFLQKLIWVVDEKLKYSLLEKRLVYLFRYLTDDLDITIQQVNKVKNGWQTTFLIDTMDFDYLIEYQCKLTVVEAKQTTINILNQIESDKKLERLNQQLLENIDLLTENILAGLFHPEKDVNIQLMFYPKS
ncbi:hypothetical protein ABID99_002322 [Mucilaginibacter sp. OAE612]|uniref:hypothetical protein n=1 Tax=Mucilaginibacter sp. OAE612 TaxID=3156444 RepID=UPI00359D4CE5